MTRSLLKHTDLNRTEFLPKILLFPEDCASSGLSQDPSSKKTIYEIWKYSLWSTLQFALYKIKIRLLESDQNGYVMGLVQNHFYHAVKMITLRKNLFFKKINYYVTVYILTVVLFH